MELVTGHAGTLHITAKQVSRLLRGVTATDESTVQRLNVGNNAAITYSGITMSIASGELLLDGYHVTLVDDTGGASGETLIFDATLESTNSRIDKVVLEIVQDNTTSYQRAEIVIVQGEESDSPVAPATPTEPESSTEEFLAVGVIAQVTITGDDISSLSDLTNLYGGNYVEYTKFEDTISDLVNVYGAKNLISYPYRAETSTNRGIIFTVNSDGSVAFSGTPTDTNPSYFSIVRSSFLPKGTYILSDGEQATYGGAFLRFYDDEELTVNYSGQYSGLYSVNSQIVLNTTSDGGYIQNTGNTHTYGYAKQFTIESDAYVEIQIRSGTSVYPGTEISGTVYPMLRMASIDDDTYEPYAMTNQELTKSVQDIESDISETQDIISDAWNSLKTYAAGEYCIFENKLYKCLIANTGIQPPNTTYWKETTCAEEFSELNSNLTDLNTISSGVTVSLSGSRSTGTLTYYRIGKIVLVNGRIYASSSTSAVSGAFSGLPTPTQELYIPTSGGIGKFVDLRSDGGLRNYSESGSGTVSYFSFCYFSND